MDIPKHITSPEQREYFTRVMDEAREQREHDQELARIEAKKQVDILKAKEPSYEQREFRKHFIGWVTAGIFVLGAGAGIWAIVDNAQANGRHERLQKEELNQRTAQECIKAGSIWIDGDCLITRKMTP